MENLLIIASLVFIEGLLSIDNALVLAILVSKLPDKKQRRRALTWGIMGAFIFRLIGLILAVYLAKMVIFKFIGAAYLLYIAAHHFISMSTTADIKKEEEKRVSGKQFWGVVLTVELTDIAFSIDSIIAAVALSEKWWVIYTGGILGIITMRFVASVFMNLIDKYPAFKHTGYVIVAWIGFKLFLEACHRMHWISIGFNPYVFWIVMGLIFFSSFFIKIKKEKENIGELIEEIEELEADFPADPDKNSTQNNG